MILSCQKCSTSFRLDETLLKATGSKVRCSLCLNIWVAFPPEAAMEDLSEPADDGLGLGAAALATAGVVAGAAGLASDQEGGDDSDTPVDTPPELKFFADEEIDEDQGENDDLVTDEINLDELDQLLKEEGDAVAGPQPDEDFKTEELNLSDLEKMLDLEGDQTPTEPATDQQAPEEVNLEDALADDSAPAAVDKEDSVIEELDLDLEDLETLLEEDTGLGDEIAAVEETSGGLDEAAGDLDLDLDGAGTALDEIELDMAPELEDLLEEDAKAPVVEETEDIGIPEIEDALEGESSPPEMAVGDDEGITLELAPGLANIFDEDDGKDVVIEETEDLDFSELASDLEAVEAPPAEDQELELELDADKPSADLADIGEIDALDLDLEEDAGTDAEAPEIDLSDLSQALETDDSEAAAATPEVEEPELELDVDMDAPTEDAGDLELALEELDQESPAEAPGAVGEIIEETRELDADELESLLEEAGDEMGADEDASSDSLELDIDLDSLDGEAGDDMDDATRELDLDDIEKILEMDASAEDADADAVEASEDLDLDLDMDSVAPPATEMEETGEETTGTAGELDLSELEKMLDVEDTTDSPEVTDEEIDDLDLDFELQPATEESEDLDLEFDMLDEEPAEASALFDTSESEDLGLDLDGDLTKGDEGGDLDGELDFEIMDDDLAVEEVDLDIDAEEIGAATLSEPIGQAIDPRSRDLTQELMDEMAAADTQTMAAPPVETKPIKPAPPPMKKKKKSSKTLVLLFILVLLGGAGYLLPQYTDIKIPAIKMPDLSGIPVVGKYFGSPTQEAIVPVETSLAGDWVQNQQAGRLYTIQGRVKNDYTSPRSYIRVTGRVYADGRKFQKAAKAYCGNILSPEELATLPLVEIQKKLSNRTGANNSNVKVAPGKEVPFMVVFGDLPADVELQEFAVEISGSLPVAASK